MHLKNFNQRLDEHLNDCLIQIENDMSKDINNQIYYDQITSFMDEYPFLLELIKGEKDISLTKDEIEIFHEYQSIHEHLHKLGKIEMYYQGFSDAISLLTKIMKP